MTDANTTATNDLPSMADVSATPLEDANSIRLWLSHPNLYRSIMTFAVMSIGLGLNFLRYAPPFNGYDIDIRLIAWAFIALGVTKIAFLHVRRNLKAVRLTMATEVAFMGFWGVGTTLTHWTNATTFQLPVLYVALCLFETFLLIEPFANPMTGRRGA